jgi:hypothetical protein
MSGDPVTTAELPAAVEPTRQPSHPRAAGAVAAPRGIRVRRAASEDDLRRIFAFRYDVYVREMGRRQRYADHAAGLVREPLDETAHLYLAESADGSVVGTVRTNYSRDLNLAPYPELYRMGWALAALPGHVSISTKIIVARRYRTGLRSGLLSGALAMATYRDALAAGIAMDFCDCSTPAIESFFRHLGYRRYEEDVVHPELGPVRLLVLLTRDHAFLSACRSPFAALLGDAADSSTLRALASRASAAYHAYATRTGHLEESP